MVELLARLHAQNDGKSHSCSAILILLALRDWVWLNSLDDPSSQILGNVDFGLGLVEDRLAGIASTLDLFVIARRHGGGFLETRDCVVEGCEQRW